MDAMLARMTSGQFAEWYEAYLLDPWGSEVEDFRAGQIASVIANRSRDPKREPTPYRPADFFPSRIPQHEEEPDVLSKIHAVFGPMATREE